LEAKEQKHIYFLGIGGTGMAATAGLAQEAGFKVTGSDSNLYPPMSTMLEELGIPVHTPYSPENIDRDKPDLVVIANALSRGHEELESALAQQLPYTSFPAFIGDYLLPERQSIVVAGTHGKTTTCSLLAHILEELGHDPSFMIGGIPRNFPRSFKLGKGPYMVLEGDEYDTAFFDKNSKFLHYRPEYLILNNLEFDHADIFKDLAAIEIQFEALIKLVKDPKNIIANIDDPNLSRLLEKMGLLDRVTKVSVYGHTPLDKADYRLESASPAKQKDTAIQWNIVVASKAHGIRNITSKLAGQHNAANICQVLALTERLHQTQPSESNIAAAFASFDGVARRLDHLGSANGVDVYEDFAHHPTAVKQVIQGVRKSFPNRRLLVAFEPKNASSRRNIFHEEYISSLSLADEVFIGPAPVDKRIEVSERMDVQKLVSDIGQSGHGFDSNEELLEAIVKSAKSGDVVVFMSSGSFSGVQHKLVDKLRSVI
jgi:UDP-N-acetylmuramate: L-alanyl-gamma-D-glutamyl-meso-diaminopimelate ligase